MKKILVFAIIVAPLFGFSQTILGIHTELAQSSNFNFKYPIHYADTDFNLGLKYNGKKGSVTLYGKYRFGGYYMSRRLPSYALHYHALGGGITYRILNQNKRISPFIKVEIATEINSSRNAKDPIYMTSRYVPSYYIESVADVNYGGMPIMGHIYAGVDFTLTKDLYFNLNIGYEHRQTNVYIYNKLTEDYYYNNDKIFHSISLQISLSYAIPVIKKKN